MKKNIIVVVFVLLVGGGIWFLSTMEPDPQEILIPEEATGEETEESEEEIIEKEITVPLGEGAPEPEIKVMIKIGIKEGKEWNTFTWYEYDGYKVGFSVDYPSAFEVSYGGIGDTPVCLKRPIVMFSSPEKREISDFGEKDMMRVDIDSCVKLGWASTFQEFIDVQKDGRYPAEKEENIVVANKPVLKLTRIYTSPYYKELKELLEYVYINRNEETAHEIAAHINFEEQDVYLPVFDQMLSTFRFLE